MRIKIPPSIVPTILVAALFSLNGREAAAVSGTSAVPNGVGTALGGEGGAASVNVGDRGNQLGDNIGSNLTLDAGVIGSDPNLEQLLQRDAVAGQGSQSAAAARGGQFGPTVREETSREEMNDPRRVQQPENTGVPQVQGKSVAPAPTGQRNEAPPAKNKGQAPAKIAAADASPQSRWSVRGLMKTFWGMLGRGGAKAEVEARKIYHGEGEHAPMQETADGSVVVASNLDGRVPNGLVFRDQVRPEAKQTPAVERGYVSPKERSRRFFRNVAMYSSIASLVYAAVAQAGTGISSNGLSWMGWATGGLVGLAIFGALLKRYKGLRAFVGGTLGLGIIGGGAFAVMALVANPPVPILLLGIAAGVGLVTLILALRRSYFTVKAARTAVSANSEAAGNATGKVTRLNGDFVRISGEAEAARQTADDAAAAAEDAEEWTTKLAEAIQASGIAAVAATTAGGLLTTARDNAREPNRLLRVAQAEVARIEGELRGLVTIAEQAAADATAAVGTPNERSMADAARIAADNVTTKKNELTQANLNLETARTNAEGPATSLREAEAEARRTRDLAAQALTRKTTADTEKARAVAAAEVLLGPDTAVWAGKVADLGADVVRKEGLVEQAREALALARREAASVNGKDWRARRWRDASLALLLAAIVGGIFMPRFLPDGSLRSTYDNARQYVLDEWNKSVVDIPDNAAPADDAKPDTGAKSDPAAKTGAKDKGGDKAATPVEVTSNVRNDAVKGLVSGLRSKNYPTATFKDKLEKGSEAAGINKHFGEVGDQTILVVLFQKATGVAYWDKYLVLVHKAGVADGRIFVGVGSHADDKVDWVEIPAGARAAELVEMIHNSRNAQELQGILQQAAEGKLK